MKLILCLFSALFLIVTMVLASHKEFWCDECFTSIIASVPQSSEIWSALAAGVDTNPPLSYLAVRVSRALFGPGLAATRLPSALGVLVMCLGLYRIVVRWLPPSYAVAAMLFPLVTAVYYYAYEARPYGLMLGSLGMALMAWQEAIEGPWRRTALLGLGLSLAVAVSSHYYAVFAVIPLAAGELTRTYLRKRLDGPIWLAFAAGLAPLMFFLPLIKATMEYIPGFWAQATLATAPRFYIFLLQDAVPAMVAILILDPLVLRVSRWPGAADPDPNALSSFPTPQFIAAVGFAALPVVVVLLARLTTGAFTYRYALPAVLGLSLLVTDAGHRYARGRTAGGLLMVLVFLGWFCFSSGRLLAKPGMRPRPDGEPVIQQAAAREGLALAGRDDLPILVADPDLYMELAYSLSQSRASRLAYVRIDGDLTHESRALHRLRRWSPFPLSVMDVSSVLDSYDSFLVYKWKDNPTSNWIVPELAGRGAQVEVVGERGHYILFLVKSKRPSG
jgi:hypothetical protein